MEIMETYFTNIDLLYNVHADKIDLLINTSKESARHKQTLSQAFFLSQYMIRASLQRYNKKCVSDPTDPKLKT